MFVNGLGTATPHRRYTKAECWEAFRASDWFRRLDRRAHAIAEAVLFQDNGIEARRLALTSLDEGFRIDPDTLYRRFLTHAPALAAEAGAKALDDAALAPADIDAVVISTCTGYLCPGLSSYVVERLGLRTRRPGRRSRRSGLRRGAAQLARWRRPCSPRATREHVLSICVEVSSAAMYLDDDPGVLSALACSATARAPPCCRPRRGRDGVRVELTTARSLVNPDERDALRFESRQGMLRNVLTRPVPRLAADHARQVLDTALAEAGLAPRGYHGLDPARRWSRRAAGAAGAARSRATRDLGYSAAMLREYGNMSSAFVYFVLQAALADGAPAGWWWMSSFGAGFSCHGALLRVA